MTNQENSIGTAASFPVKADAQDTMAPSLVDLASQLSPETDGEANGGVANQPRKPQVVFIGPRETRTTQIIEITIDPNAMPQEPSIVEESFKDTREESLPRIVPQNLESLAAESEARFSVDPFVYEIDGPIPVMPTLPIVDAQQITEKVIARQASGEHHAWRLIAEPYPEEGNWITSADEIGPGHEPVEQASNNPWTDTEVVAHGDEDSNEDCFYAKPGQVISIDGNQGFDHIDLRSYCIDAATFQPGAILLHSEIDPNEMGEGEQLPLPISIRHRGVEFAIFKGEVRVEL